MSTDEITMLKKKAAEAEAEIAGLKAEVAKLRTILHTHANILNAITLKQEVQGGIK